MLLLAVEMTLQFDVRPPAEDATDLVHGAGVRAGEAMQTGGVLLDQLPGVAGLAFGMVQRACREELAEVLVAGAILDEEGQGRVSLERRPLRPPAISGCGGRSGRRSTGFREQQL